jgi:hypothetical protein
MEHLSRHFELNTQYYELVGCENIEGIYYSKFWNKQAKQMHRKNDNELIELIKKEGSYIIAEKEDLPLILEKVRSSQKAKPSKQIALYL